MATPDLSDAMSLVTRHIDAERLHRDFDSGEVEPQSDELPETRTTAQGYVVDLTSYSPIATPAFYEGRLYVSGGFSTTEFHCLEADDGSLVWSVHLSDDGPSWAAIDDGVVTFNTESCTLFALDAKTGEELWSFYLGDPLLSSPTIAGGRVYAAYPLNVYEDVVAEFETGNDKEGAARGPIPTHALICLELKTGETLWQHSLDSDCITAPVAAGDDVFLTTMTGRLYRFRQSDGKILAAADLLATAPPVICDDAMYLTRRINSGDGDQPVLETIVRYGRQMQSMQELAFAWPAPYLDREIQEFSSFSGGAGSFEQMNGIGGGFGGGFFGGSGDGGGSGSGGFFQLPDESAAGESASQDAVSTASEPADSDSELDGSLPPDLLAHTQRRAADVIGLGNVSTLQCYQGSRPLRWADRCFSCVGDRVVCLDAALGELIWERSLPGDIRESGGHLGTPPVAAGDWLFVATVSGDVLQISPVDGRIHASHHVGSEVRFAPTVMEGRIYIGTQDGKVVCIQTHDPTVTGWPLWGRDAAHSNIYDGTPPWR